MEISKGLQLEIQSVQSKLKNAIRDHQICVGKLKDDPNNSDILERIQEIQLHIVSLGRCQKQVVQRLRKEVDDFKAVNANDVKVSVASLLGLNNNNHITTNNESRNNDISEVRVVSNGLDNARLASAKEDYEDIVRNGDVASLRENSLKKERSISVETLSADDEEIIEVSVEEKTRENKRRMSEEPLDERRIKCTEQLSFLEVLGLITTLKSTELQNRKAERKRRSTANPQFVHSNWDVPTKRKRHNYLQSAGNVPQTRQTTARLNGPSPPPASNKSSNPIVPPKSTSPPTLTLSKSLVPTQKATTRPNILRNMSESRVFPNKSTRIENESRQLPLTCTTTKTSQSTINSKTVHIPGLPSGLTIERIENDSAVCINCRNPGTLTNCDNCEANYHVSCHTISPPPTRLCPKCAFKAIEAPNTIKKNDELAAASYAPGVAGKAGEDPEIDKASRGFYKFGTNARHQIVATGRCINKLSGSTFLIPITPNPIATAISIPKPAGNVTAIDESTINVVKPVNDTSRGHANTGNVSYSTTIVVNNQFSRSNVTYVPQSDNNSTAYTYKLPIYESELQKSYERIEESRVNNEHKEGGENENRSIIDESRHEEGKIIGAIKISGLVDERKQDFSTIKTIDSSSNQQQQLQQHHQQQQQQIDKFPGRVAESMSRGWKKSTTRALPGLTRIVKSNDKQQSIPPDHGHNDNLDELQKCSYNGGSSGITIEEQQDRKRNVGAANEYLEENDNNGGGYGKSNGDTETTRDRKIENQTESLFSRGKHRSGKQFNSLFAGYNKPDSITDRTGKSKQSEGASSSSRREITNDGGAFNDNFVKFSLADDIGNRSDRFKIIPSTEHVKLEEAHLSAPSGAKLMRKNDNEKSTLRNYDFSWKNDTSNRHLPNRRRTTEDRASLNCCPRDFYGEVKFERRQMPRILMRSERKSLDSNDALRDGEIIVEKIRAADLLSFQKNYSNSFVRLRRDEKKHPENEDSSGSDTSATEDASSPVNLHDRNSRNVETVNDDEKNEIDGKELTSGGEKLNENIYRGDNLKVDEETEDNEEDVEDDEDQDSPIVDEEIREGGIEELRISTVSPESMQVLEQFETAMMQVESDDKTANP